MHNTEKEHLAIASVPCQKWEKPYDAETALIKGTVFPKLNKPFFKADSLDSEPAWVSGAGQNGKDQEQADRENLLKQIYEVSFLVNDLTLYLDTHDEDKEAIALFTENNLKRTQLMADFANQYYPLTQACMAKCSSDATKFCWTEGPMPWEGACI